MKIFKRKCGYCKKKIDPKEDNEKFKDVKMLGIIGTREKAFCCLEHVEQYEKAIEEHLKKPKTRGSCCG